MSNYPKSIKDGKKHNYSFWKNKPVAKFDSVTLESREIEDDLSKRKVYGSNEETKLPDSMKWVTINMNNSDLMESVAQFLRTYYLIDLSETFRLYYTANFIKWILGNDGMLIAIAKKDTNAICGVVGSSFKNLTVFDKVRKFANVDFLCAHPAYRHKKIAHILIDEITRRIVQNGVHQSCFTSERCIPTPTTVLRYYHRPINYIKLQKHGYSDVGGNPTKVQEKFNVEKVIPNGYHVMTENDINEVYQLYVSYMTRFNIYCNYTVDEMKYLLLNEHIKAYVIKHDDKIIDFVSYYVLPSFSVKQTEMIDVAYMFMYSCIEISGDDLIENMLKILAYNSVDVFTVIDSGRMSDFLFIRELNNDEDSDAEMYDHLYEHKFLKGSGKVHFNLVNWVCPEIKPKQLSWIVF